MLRSAGFIAVALLFVFVSCDPVETVRAAGATFPEDVYNTWSSAYFAENPDVNIEYESTGSGTGKERIVEGSDVVFVGSDRGNYGLFFKCPCLSEILVNLFSITF